jgi:hypothetical protein
MAEALKIYNCLTNNHTKVIQFSLSKAFPVMVECNIGEYCAHKTKSEHRPGKTVCSLAGKMDEKTFSRIERRNSIPNDPA